MSGHHPPSWNHHPMQVPPYIPRLPMAHMSNDRPVSGAWHNNGPNGPPQMPPNPASGHNMGNPELNQYPPPPSYHGQNNRNQMLPPPPPTGQYGGRHPMHGAQQNNDYDSPPMMDLSVSRNNNSSGDHQMHPGHMMNHHHQAQHQQQQQHSNKHQQSMCDGPMLPSDSSLNEGYHHPHQHHNEMDMLNRRQNPIGLPPLADAMELVKDREPAWSRHWHRSWW